ncbi:MAG: hypothetical protein K0R18_1970 [Bacillales bacterium]|nr:hypothetical protein [Bacillales bacterium]
MLRFLFSVMIIAAIITVAIIPIYGYLRRIGKAERKWIDQNLIEEEKKEVDKNDTNE